MLAFARLPPGAINYAAFQRPAKRPIHPTLVEATLDAAGCVGTLFPTPIVPNEITLFIANERECENSRVITCKQIPPRDRERHLVEKAPGERRRTILGNFAG